MPDLDPEGVEAAARALHDDDIRERAVDLSYPECGDHYRDRARLAITAYEAHRAANLPQDPTDEDVWQHRCADGIGGCTAISDSYLLSLFANLPSQRDDTEAEHTLFWLEQIAACARAEVLAQGYRSSDMARALQALDGEFWFENYVPPLVPSSKQVCGYAVTTEMDDGPLTQRCSRRPHGSEVEHYFGANLPSREAEVGLPLESKSITVVILNCLHDSGYRITGPHSISSLAIPSSTEEDKL